MAPGSASFSSGHTSQSCSSQGSSQDSTESSQEASSGHSGSGSSDCDDAPPWDSESLSSSGDDLARVFMSDLVEDMMTSERHARGLQVSCARQRLELHSWGIIPYKSMCLV